MHTFDYSLNTHLNHEHPEYLQQGDLAQVNDKQDSLLSTLEQLRSDLENMRNNYTDKNLVQNLIGQDHSQIMGMIDSIANQSQNINPSEMDGGTFTQPQYRIFFDAGSFI